VSDNISAYVQTQPETAESTWRTIGGRFCIELAVRYAAIRCPSCLLANNCMMYPRCKTQTYHCRLSRPGEAGSSVELNIQQAHCAHVLRPVESHSGTRGNILTRPFWRNFFWIFWCTLYSWTTAGPSNVAGPGL